MAELDVALSRWGVSLEGEAFASGELELSEFEQAMAASTLVDVAGEAEAAKLRVEAQPNSVFKFYTTDSPTALAAFRIPTKRSTSLPRKVQGIVEHLTIYNRLLALQAPSSFIPDAVDLQFVRLLEPAKLGIAPEAEPLVTDDASDYMMQAGQNLAIAFTHRAPDPLYLYVLAMDGRSLSASVVYPYKAEFSARVKPGETVTIGAGPVYLLEMQAPKEYPSGIDIFKVFVSSKAIEHPDIKLPRLGSSREKLTDLYGSGTRLDRELRRFMTGTEGTAAMPSFDREPWWTVQKTIRITKA